MQAIIGLLDFSQIQRTGSKLVAIDENFCHGKGDLITPANPLWERPRWLPPFVGDVVIL